MFELGREEAGVLLLVFVPRGDGDPRLDGSCRSDENILLLVLGYEEVGGGILVLPTVQFWDILLMWASRARSSWEPQLAVSRPFHSVGSGTRGEMGIASRQVSFVGNCLRGLFMVNTEQC